MRLLVVCCWAGAAAGLMPVAHADGETLDRFIGRFAGFGMFDGTVLVDAGGEVIYRRSFGKASYEFDIDHNRETRFRIASVSKLVTDVAVARLVDEGSMNLDDPLKKYLPDFPSSDAITVEHLLRQTSGIAHTNDQPWGEEAMTLDVLVARLAEVPLDFAPGSKASYSNGGYAVLAKAIETATGQSFGDALRDLVFDPLGMTGSGHITDSRAPIEKMASAYEPGTYPGRRRHSRYYAVESRPAGGSLYSTADDLHRFARAVFRDGFVSDAARDAILGYDGRDYLSQGRSPGYVSKLLYSAEEDIIVVSVANNYAVPADWASAIAAYALDAKPESGWPEIRRADETAADDDPRIGKYTNSFGGGIVEITHGDEGALIFRDEGNDSNAALIMLEDNQFLLPLYYQLCEQDSGSRVISCGILSGNTRYRSTLTPAD